MADPGGKLPDQGNAGSTATQMELSALQGMMDDLGIARLEELPLDDGTNDRDYRRRNHDNGVEFRDRERRTRGATVPMDTSLGSIWQAAIVSGAFDDDDAAAVKGLSDLGGGRLYDAPRGQQGSVSRRDAAMNRTLAILSQNNQSRPPTKIPPRSKKKKASASKNTPAPSPGPVPSVAPIGPPQTSTGRGRGSSTQRPAPPVNPRKQAVRRDAPALARHPLPVPPSPTPTLSVQDNEVIPLSALELENVVFKAQIKFLSRDINPAWQAMLLLFRASQPELGLFAVFVCGCKFCEWPVSAWQDYTSGTACELGLCFMDQGGTAQGYELFFNNNNELLEFMRCLRALKAGEHLETLQVTSSFRIDSAVSDVSRSAGSVAHIDVGAKGMETQQSNGVLTSAPVSKGAAHIFASSEVLITLAQKDSPSAIDFPHSHDRTRAPTAGARPIATGAVPLSAAIGSPALSNDSLEDPAQKSIPRVRLPPVKACPAAPPIVNEDVTTAATSTGAPMESAESPNQNGGPTKKTTVLAEDSLIDLGMEDGSNAIPIVDKDVGVTAAGPSTSAPVEGADSSGQNGAPTKKTSVLEDIHTDLGMEDDSFAVSRAPSEAVELLSTLDPYEYKNDSSNAGLDAELSREDIVTVGRNLLGVFLLRSMGGDTKNELAQTVDGIKMGVMQFLVQDAKDRGMSAQKLQELQDMVNGVFNSMHTSPPHDVPDSVGKEHRIQYTPETLLSLRHGAIAPPAWLADVPLPLKTLPQKSHASAVTPQLGRAVDAMQWVLGHADSPATEPQNGQNASPVTDTKPVQVTGLRTSRWASEGTQLRHENNFTGPAYEKGPMRSQLQELAQLDPQARVTSGAEDVIDYYFPNSNVNGNGARQTAPQAAAPERAVRATDDIETLRKRMSRLSIRSDSPRRSVLSQLQASCEKAAQSSTAGSIQPQPVPKLRGLGASRHSSGASPATSGKFNFHLPK